MPLVPSYRKRGKGWEVTYDVPRVEGRRRQRTKAGFRTRREAQDWYELNAPEARRQPVTGSVTLADYAVRWLEAKRPPVVRPSTWRSYRAVLDNRIIPQLGELRLDRLTEDTLLAWQTRLLERYRPSTVIVSRGVLSEILDDAHQRHILPANPLQRVRAPAAQPPSFTVWEEPDIIRFIEVNEGSPGALLFLLALFTGLRRGELLALTWADVDMTRGTLSVVNNDTVDVEGKRTTGPPKTRTSRRTITLPSTVLRWLREHRRQQNETRLMAGPAWVETNLVFTRWNGVSPHPSTALAWLRNAVEAAGLPDMTFRGLRHTMATWELVIGEHPKVVQERLGHSSITMTLDTYSHVSEGMQRQAAERLENVLQAARGQDVGKRSSS